MDSIFPIMALFLFPISIAGCIAYIRIIIEIKNDTDYLTRLGSYLFFTPIFIFIVCISIFCFLQILGFIIELFN